jgi:hypothetical protein
MDLPELLIGFGVNSVPAVLQSFYPRIKISNTKSYYPTGHAA